MALLLAATTSPARADCPAAPITDPDDMAISFLASNGVQAASASLLASTVKEGIVVYDDANDALKLCDGNNWIAVGSSSGTDTLASLSCAAGQIAKFNGTAWACATDGGGGGTTGPAFSVHKNGTNQTSVANSSTVITWPTEVMDTNNNFASNRFTPTVAGRYIVTAQVRCSSSANCITQLRKNGTLLVRSGIVGNGSTSNYGGPTTAIVEMNGSTDYLDVTVFNDGTDTVSGSANDTYFMGSMIGGGSGSDTLSGLSCAANEIPKWNGTAWACATDGGGVGGDAASYLIKGMSANQSGLASGTVVAFTTHVASAGTKITHIGNRITVAGGSRYMLRAFIRQGTAGQALDYRIFDVTNGANVPSAVASANSNSNFSDTDATAFVAPSASTTYEVRVAGGGGSALSGYSYFSAMELGGGSATAAGDEGQIQFNDGSDGFAADGALHWDNVNKRLGIGTNVPQSSLHVSTDNDVSTILLESARPSGGASSLTMRSARGTLASKTAAQSGDQLFFLGGRGYGDTTYPSASTVQIVGYASENATDSSQATDLRFRTTPTGSVAPVTNMMISSVGDVGINTLTPTQKLEVRDGGIALSSPNNSVTLTFRPEDQAGTYLNTADERRFQLMTTGMNDSVFGYKFGWRNADGSARAEALSFHKDGRVGIGVNSPHPSAKLDVTSTTSGFLPPRMDEGQRDAIASPATGLMIFNTTAGQYQFWSGTAWAGLGGAGVPTGTIAAFASSTCPSGWTEYTAARGRFLRGIDNGAGNDPDGTRAPGNTQADKVGPHTHDTTGNRIVTTSGGVGLNAGADRYWNGNFPVTATSLLSGGDVETRPKNVAVLFCQYTGYGGGGGPSALADLTDVDLAGLANGKVLTYNSSTSKWEAVTPSGGTAAGSVAGALQFNDGSNAFAADDVNLVWDNTNKRLGVGTATPGYPLDVSVSRAGGGLVNFRNEAANGYTTISLRDEANVSSALLGWANSGASSFAGSAYFGTSVASPLHLITGLLERLTILSNGNVGVGTATPQSKLEVVNATGGTVAENYVQITGSTANNTNYPGISLKGGSLANSYPRISVNNGGYGLYLGGGTSGVVTDRAGMTFDSVAGTSFTFGATTAMQILPTGNVGIGPSAPNATLDVAGAIFASTDGTKLGRVTFATSVSAPTTSPVWNIDGTGGKMRFFREPSLDTPGTVYMVLDDTGYLGVGVGAPGYRVDLPNTSGLGGRGRANQWTTYSDGRFKTNVETIDHALDKITALRGVSYVSTTETNGERQVGFIAQEVEKIVPEVVSISKTSVTMPDGSTQVVDDYRSLAYDRLVPVLTEAIRELKADNDNLRAQLKAANDNNAAQDAVLEDLRVQIEALKASR